MRSISGRVKQYGRLFFGFIVFESVGMPVFLLMQRKLYGGEYSLRGRRLEGKGKAVLGAREARGPRAPPISLAPKNSLSLPFQTPATQAMGNRPTSDR